MAKQYPTIGSATLKKAWEKNPKCAPPCIVSGCQSKATHRVAVEVNWFRGDDEVANACPLHRKDTYAVLGGIEARYGAKEGGAA